MFYHTSIDGGKNRVNYHDCLPADPRVFIVGHRIRRLGCKFINKGIGSRSENDFVSEVTV